MLVCPAVDDETNNKRALLATWYGRVVIESAFGRLLTDRAVTLANPRAHVHPLPVCKPYTRVCSLHSTLPSGSAGSKLYRWVIRNF